MARLSEHYAGEIASDGTAAQFVADTHPKYVRDAVARKIALDEMVEPPPGAFVIDPSGLGDYKTFMDALRAHRNDASANLHFWFVDGTHDIGDVVIPQDVYSTSVDISSKKVTVVLNGYWRGRFKAGDHVAVNNMYTNQIRGYAIVTSSLYGGGKTTLVIDYSNRSETDNIFLNNDPIDFISHCIHKRHDQGIRFTGQSKHGTVLNFCGLEIGNTAYNSMVRFDPVTNDLIVQPGSKTVTQDATAYTGNWVGDYMQGRPGWITWVSGDWDTESLEYARVVGGDGSNVLYLESPYLSRHNFRSLTMVGSEAVYVGLDEDMPFNPDYPVVMQRFTLTASTRLAQSSDPEYNPAYGATPYDSLMLIALSMGPRGSVVLTDLNFDWRFGRYGYVVDRYESGAIVCAEFCDATGNYYCDIECQSGSAFVCCTWDGADYDFINNVEFSPFIFPKRGASYFYACEFGPRFAIDTNNTSWSQSTFVNCHLETGTPIPLSGTGNWSSYPANANPAVMRNEDIYSVNLGLYINFDRGLALTTRNSP